MSSKFNLLKILPVTCLIIIGACTQKEAAQVDYYGKNYYGRSGVKQSSQGRPSFIIVKPGDSLLSLSKKYKISYNDLLKANNLSEGHVIKVGEKLHLPKSNYHKVVTGETLSKIARQYNISTQKLAEINNLEEPYTIRLGQLLAISNNNIVESEEAITTYNPQDDDNSYSPVKIQQLDSPEIQTSNNDEEVEQQEENDEIKQEIKKEEKESELKAELSENEAKVIKPIIPQVSKFLWPIQGKILSKFGPLENGGKNDGINIAADEGTPIKAAANGVVVYSGNGLKGYGNLIILKHADGTLSAYAHQADLIIDKDAKVKQGQVIGHVGSTGNVSSPQLHFAIREGKKPVDPLNFLPKI